MNISAVIVRIILVVFEIKLIFINEVCGYTLFVAKLILSKCAKNSYILAWVMNFIFI